MISLDEFKTLNADDIADLSEKEVEFLYNISVNFANFAYKKWSDERVINQA